MAGDTKKTKADPAPKSEVAAKKAKSTSAEDAAKTSEAPKASEALQTSEAAKTSDAATPATGETATAPSDYSRGEGQKPVTAAYKENWNAIFGNKKTKKKNKKKSKR